MTSSVRAPAPPTGPAPTPMHASQTAPPGETRYITPYHLVIMTENLITTQTPPGELARLYASTIIMAENRTAIKRCDDEGHELERF